MDFVEKASRRGLKKWVRWTSVGSHLDLFERLILLWHMNTELHKVLGDHSKVL